MFSGVSGLDASFYGFYSEAMSHWHFFYTARSLWLVSLIMALAKAASRGLSPSKSTYTIPW